MKMLSSELSRLLACAFVICCGRWPFARGLKGTHTHITAYDPDDMDYKAMTLNQYESAREQEYLREQAKLPVCFKATVPSDGHLPSPRDQTYRISILSSRFNYVNASLNSWMRLLPENTAVTLAQNQDQFDEKVWSKLPLHVESYTTSSAKNKNNYHKAAEVYLSAVKTAAKSVKTGSFNQDWYIFLDDDTFIHPDIFDVLKLHDPDEPVILANKYASHYTGGHGIYLSRKAMHYLDSDCMELCDPEMVWGDVSLAVMLGSNSNIIQFPNVDKLAKHYCGPGCMEDEMSRAQQLPSWRPSHFAVEELHSC